MPPLLPPLRQLAGKLGGFVDRVLPLPQEGGSKGQRAVVRDLGDTNDDAQLRVLLGAAVQDVADLQAVLPVALQ